MPAILVSQHPVPQVAPYCCLSHRELFPVTIMKSVSTFSHFWIPKGRRVRLTDLGSSQGWDPCSPGMRSSGRKGIRRHLKLP